MQYLAEGDVIQIKIGNKVNAKVPKHFLYSNRRGDFSLSSGTVTIDDNFSYLAGKYVVVRALMNGGGTGHGQHDVFPDGWHVYCKSLDNENEINFYQSGCFDTLNTDVEVVGKAEMTWVFNK